MTEQEVYSGEHDGLREAAAEITANRASGESGVENPELPAPHDHDPIERAADPSHDDKGINIRQAGKELGDERRKAAEGDEEFARAMGEHVPEAPDLREVEIDKLLAARDHFDEQGNELERINQELKQSHAKLEQEIEERRQREALAAQREAALAKLAADRTGDEIDKLAQARQAQLIELYPDMLTDEAVAEAARTDPVRYGEYVNALQYVRMK